MSPSRNAADTLPRNAAAPDAVVPRPDRLEDTSDSKENAPAEPPPRPKPIEEDEVLGKAFDWTLTKRLFTFVRPYAAQVRRALFLSVVLAGLGLLGPYLFKVAIDGGIARHNMALLVGISVAYLMTQFAVWRLGYEQNVRLAEMAQNVLFDLRDALFGHLQALSLDFYDRRASGRLLSRLTNDIESLNELVTSGMINLVSDSLSLLGIIAIMLALNWRLALLTFTLIPLIFIVSRLFGRRARSAFRESRKKIATVTANLAESLNGVRVTKSFGREKQNLEKFGQVNEENMRASLAAVLVFATFFPILELIGAVGTMMVLWYGGLMIVHSHGVGATPGLLAAFLGYVDRFFQPIRNTTRLYNSLQSAMASAERVFDILDTAPSVQEQPGAPDLPAARGEVAFECVSFAYEPGQEVLHDLNLRVAAGETVAIVGPTGAGKSTLIALLARLYDPTAGRITIDGTDSRAVTLASLRRQMGVVLQDSFLFSGTVRENITYGKPDAEIRAAAQLVGADRFIERLPQGYDTPVEERGQRLSIGQRQLISFARALLADPRILILDEATASIDAYTEMLIQNALRALLRGRTAFLIAHRLSTVVEADRILVLKDGRIVEQGTHAQLLAAKGLYAQLYARQFADSPDETAVTSAP
ncbi:MAG TPA: ABC transporter ATP-binding protein [Chthonomonadaceae bacterium]|nr:ABC transporter ATP-binding protein [Chthonomonadaceae bacterium]